MKPKIEIIDIADTDLRWRAAYVTGTRNMSATLLKTHLDRVASAGIHVVKILEGFNEATSLPKDLDLVVVNIDLVPRRVSEGAIAEARSRKIPVARVELKWSQTQRVLKTIGVLHDNGTPLPPKRCGLIAAVSNAAESALQAYEDRIVENAILQEAMNPGSTKRARQRSVAEDSDDSMRLLAADLFAARAAEEARIAADDAEIEAELQRLQKEEEEMALVKTELKLVQPAQPPQQVFVPPQMPVAREPSLLERFDTEISSIDDAIEELEDELTGLRSKVLTAEARKEMFTKRQTSLRTSREQVVSAMAVIESPRAQVDAVVPHPGPLAPTAELRDAIMVLLLDRKEDGLTGGEVRKAIDEQHLYYGPHRARISSILRDLVDEERLRCAISRKRGGYRYWPAES